jgi:hypothetical protein
MRDAAKLPLSSGFVKFDRCWMPLRHEHPSRPLSPSSTLKTIIDQAKTP